MNKKVNILFSSSPDFSGNSKALYEYVKKSYNTKVDSFWVLYSEKDLTNFQNTDIKYVLFHSKDYFSLIEKIDIIFDTHGALLTEKRENQIYVNLWHGSSPKSKGYLLSSENFAPQDIQYCKNMHLKADYIVTFSQLSRLIFSSAFDLNVQRVIPLGYCRDEYLFTCDGKKILRNLLGKDITMFSKILFYLPTFRNGCNRKDSDNFWENNLLELEKYSEEELYTYLEENNYLLIIKKHPSEISELKVSENKNIIILEEEMLRNKLIDIYQIINAADLLIADYSSIYVEYLLLQRPVLFLHKALETYKEKRGIIFDNISFWSPGPQVNTLENLKIEICSLLEKPDYYAKERNLFKKIMFNNDYNSICKNTFEFFINPDNLTLKCNSYNSDERLLIKNFEKLSEEYDNLNLYNENLKNEFEKICNSKSWKLLMKFQQAKIFFRRK